MHPSDQDLNRLRWRCRRGMRELDTLLMHYVERYFAKADEAEQTAFQALISLPDPEILGLLMGRLRSEDEEINRVVERLLAERIP